MRPELLEVLRCPRSGQRLRVVEGELRDGRIENGSLASEDGLHRYPIRGFVPRFVPQSNYADSFGMQWNRFGRTQLDSFSGHPISAQRFWGATGWSPPELSGHWVLDAGCGAGRFAEISGGTGAKVVALDYSSAVDACHRNLERFSNVHVVQGDIYQLPLQPAAFSCVYSLGVLQHTPDVARAFAALPPMVRAGGRLCVDFYEKSWRSLLLPKYWLRPITKRLPRDRLFSLVQWYVPKLLPLSHLVGLVPVIGPKLRRMVPVANWEGELPLDERQRLEWAVLDTFDWLSPQYDHPQTPVTVRRWLHAAGTRNIEVLRAGHLVGRATAPGEDAAQA